MISGTYWGAAVLAAGVGTAVFFFLRWVHRKSAPRALPMDEMEGHDFEYYCAEVLQQCGFGNVEVTRGSGDFGADILCEKDGVTYAVQCKCYESYVGVHAVQEIYAGCAYYGCMVGAVMTNRYFTGPAKTMARKLNVLLWDRDWMNCER
jgi:restriction system protein